VTAVDPSSAAIAEFAAENSSAGKITARRILLAVNTFCRRFFLLYIAKKIRRRTVFTADLRLAKLGVTVKYFQQC